ncbi:MAG: DUF4326 domain-containing protein [Myxococcales bacterium]|nr:DUF4326 domain-containing protein [Myxococcales bacterium]
MPERIKLSRKKGWRKPPNTTVVARPSVWGNPWRVVDETKIGNGWVVLDPDWMANPQRHFCSSRRVARRLACWFHRRWIITPFGPTFDIERLRGKNLACWCQLDQPCHADTLLEFANRLTSSGRGGGE